VSTTPLVSVVIPAFNAEKFVERAIESVLSQTYPNLELIVVDDGSTDRTAEIAASFDDPRFRLLAQPNRGVSAARNRGMAESSGPLIAFLDADDQWDANKLNEQVKAIASQPGCVAIGCLMRYESRNQKVLGITGQSVGSGERELIRHGKLMPFPLSSILFDKGVIQEVGGFDENLRFAEDLDLLARVSGVGIVAGLASCLGTYVIHRESASAQQLKSQPMTTRYVRERIKRRANDEDLTWDEFQGTYRPTWAQRHGDIVRALYRRTAESVAEERWAKAWMLGALTGLLGPRYSFRRFLMQREGSQHQSG